MSALSRDYQLDSLQYVCTFFNGCAAVTVQRRNAASLLETVGSTSTIYCYYNYKQMYNRATFSFTKTNSSVVCIRFFFFSLIIKYCCDDYKKQEQVLCNNEIIIYTTKRKDITA